MSKHHEPQECNCRRGAYRSTIDVPCTSGDYTSYSKSHNNADILQERGAEYLSQDDGNKGQETQAYEFRRSPATRTTISLVFQGVTQNKKQKTYGSGRGAAVVGHSEKSPLAGRV
jgi:hypothetical protein